MFVLSNCGEFVTDESKFDSIYYKSLVIKVFQQKETTTFQLLNNFLTIHDLVSYNSLRPKRQIWPIGLRLTNITSQNYFLFLFMTFEFFQCESRDSRLCDKLFPGNKQGKNGYTIKAVMVSLSHSANDYFGKSKGKPVKIKIPKNYTWKNVASRADGCDAANRWIQCSERISAAYCFTAQEHELCSRIHKKAWLHSL